MNAEQIAFLVPILGTFRSVGNEILFFCPFCNHHKQKLSIRIDSFVWKCWVCDVRGHGIPGLLRKLRVPVRDAEDLFPSSLPAKEKQEDAKVQLPNGFVPIYGNPSMLAKRASNYLSNRGIHEEDILRHKIGFLGFDRIVFPSFDAKGYVNFWTARSMDDATFPKYLNPPADRNEIIINELNLNFQKPVILVEGFIDMIKAGSANVAPLFGSVLSENSQLFRCIVINETPVCLALDRDAWKKQASIAKRLLSFGIAVSEIAIPCNDVGEMQKDAFAALRSSPVSRVSLILKSAKAAS